jgi:hypothetical protein
MKLKPIKPAHCAFADFGNAFKNFVAFDTLVVANLDAGGIYKSNFHTFTEANDINKKHHWSKNTMFDSYKTTVRQLFMKFLFLMYTDVMQIVMLKIFESSEMKEQ